MRTPTDRHAALCAPLLPGTSGHGGQLKRKRYDNEEKSNAILFYDNCVNTTTILDPLAHASRETGIPAPNISRWANSKASDGTPFRDHSFKAAGDTKLKRLKVGSKPKITSRFPLAEKQLAKEIRARRARGRKGRFLFKHRLNVDQVPLPFVVGDYDHTIEDKGSKDVWVRQPGSGLEKRQATLQICIRAGKDAEGNNLPQPPLALWFRGTGKRISEAEKAAYHPDVHVYWQKCAWVDRPSSIEWQNGTLIPWLREHIPDDESVIFADKLDAQIQPEYLANQKEKASSLGWSLLKGGTNWSQPVDQELSASDRRILMTWWAGNGNKRTCGRVDFNRYFEKTGCLLDVNGEGDDKITPEGLSSFAFDRPIISAVLSTTPVQENLQSTSHAELEESVLREELAEEEELSDEDEGTAEAEKWCIPTGYLAELTAPPANQLNHSLVGWHLMFKWNGVGWCHGWVNKFYPKHRRGGGKVEVGERKAEVEGEGGGREGRGRGGLLVKISGYISP
ncbi:hypothetical protein CYMTET_49366 [Cymbomonas tetramitiformis]|uniref:Uncharacterized protein n=1 Tax=Cymbomonas tetramitiformis TaxID=36881 RepID=A0AAE0BQB5_9CHLO|nr:hypothetical protein CYMTET_49366 [Cymbomonas tetramitiformis]